MAIIGSLLGNDWYNFTMSALMRRQWPDAIVGYGFTNRNADFPIADYVDIDELRDEIEAFRSLRFTKRELSYLRSLDVFTQADLQAWASMRLPEVCVEVEEETRQLRITAEGPWFITTFIETPVLAIVTELVSRRLAAHQGLGQAAIRRNCHRLLDTTIDGLLAHPDLRFAQFGSRRRFSNANEFEVTIELARRVPEQMVGISNVEFAREFGYPASGTIAHQWEMVIAALNIGAGILNPLQVATQQAMDVWEQGYGDKWDGGLLCAIPDTFGTDYFLTQLTAERLSTWRTFKQDSGDPKVFATKLMARIEELGYNPRDFRINHTDGLDLKKMIDLYDWCDGRYQIGFGWGTKLTNNVGVATHSLVWKPMYVWVGDTKVWCVKLSDNLNKAVGDAEMVERLKALAGYTNTYTAEQDV